MVASPLIKFKDGATAKEFGQIEPQLQLILDDCARFCHAGGYDFVITDLLSDAFTDKRLGRVSTSHLEGRAADVSVRGWDEEFIAKFVAWVARVYGHLGAVSKSDGKRRVVVDHVGTARHLHIQIARRN